jgi:hypothetical protein
MRVRAIYSSALMPLIFNVLLSFNGIKRDVDEVHIYSSDIIYGKMNFNYKNFEF